MDDFLSKKAIYIWGTGQNCGAFISKLEPYLSSGLRIFGSDWKASFKGFIDSSKEKIGKTYNGSIIVSPENAVEEMDYCIITVSDNSEIISYLNRKGFNENQWIFWSDYIKKCKDAVLVNCSAKDAQNQGVLSTYIRFIKAC